MIQVGIAAEKSSCLITSHEHDAEQGTNHVAKNVMGIFFSGFWALVWFVADLQKLFYLYQGVTT